MEVIHLEVPRMVGFYLGIEGLHGGTDRTRIVNAMPPARRP
jgi:hypothetical protein